MTLYLRETMIPSHTSTYRFEDALECLVGDAIFEWYIDSIVLSLVFPLVFLSTRPWKVLAKLMKRARHDPIGRVKRLLDAIPMVAIDVNVQHTGIRPQQLQDPEHDIIDVAKSRRLAFLGVMQPASPVYRDVCSPRRDALRRS